MHWRHQAKIGSLWQLHPGGFCAGVLSTKWPCPKDFFKEPCLLKFRFGVLSALRSMAWCDHCSGMMMRNSTGKDDHVVMRCVSLIGDMSHVPTGCNLVVCYHSISWLDNTLQPHAELTCIYIYIYILWDIFIRIVSLRASSESRPFQSSWTRTSLGGSWNDSIFMKCGQLLWNADNLFEFDKKFWNNALSSWLDYTK